MNAALALFDAAIAQGDDVRAALASPLVLTFEDGGSVDMPYADWVGQAVAGDHAMLSRCTGPTLDIGCGPGRLVEALLRAGIPALGIDISEESLRQTRDRGGVAMQRDVFTRVPGEHRWEHLLLADGNIGIGGDPLGLLSRCRTLIADEGTVLVEVSEPTSPTRVGRARLESTTAQSPWFPWAVLSADDAETIARSAGLSLRELWTEADRWFVELEPRT